MADKYCQYLSADAVARCCQAVVLLPVSQLTRCAPHLHDTAPSAGSAGVPAHQLHTVAGPR